MADTFDYSPVTYTMKGGKGYEEPWVVFHGTPDAIRENALAIFGMEQEQFAGVATSDVLSELNEIFNGTRQVMKTLGGSTVKPSEEVKPSAGHDPWASEPTPDSNEANADDPVDKMLERIEAVTDVAALKSLWAKNKELFNDSRLMDAYKAKGKALTA